MNFHVIQKKNPYVNAVMVHGAYNDFCYARYGSVASLKKHWLGMKFIQMNGSDYKMAIAHLKDDAGNTFTIFPIFGFWFPNEVIRDLNYVKAVWEEKATWPYDPVWYQPLLAAGGTLLEHPTLEKYENHAIHTRQALIGGGHKKNYGVIMATRYSGVWPVKKTLASPHTGDLSVCVENEYDDEPVLVAEPWSPDEDDDDEEDNP